MSQVIKRENMTISIREYTDNNGDKKKVWKTIGELITWDDGKQSFEQWGPGGVVKGNVFEQTDKNAQTAPQQQPQQQYQQQPPQQQQAPQQQQYPPQQAQNNTYQG